MAATALDLYLPYDAGAGSAITEDQWRSMARHFLTSGPIRGELSDFALAATSGRNVTVSAGRCYIAGQWGERSTAFTQAITTNSSGNPRIDRIVLRNDFSANRIEIDVVVGTPAGSPSVPALTQNTSIWEISLGYVTVASGYTSIAAGDITDERAFAQGRPPGGPVIVGVAAIKSSNASIPSNTVTAINFDDSERYDTAAIHSLVSNTSRFTIPGGCTGLWGLDVSAVFESAVTGHIVLQLFKNSVVLGNLYEREGVAAGSPKLMARYMEEQFAVGDFLQIYAFQNGTGNTQVISSARCNLRYLGLLS